MERLKTMTILALLAALAGSIALAATSGEAEVRINARKLEDGRVEFALQQRVDGEWGKRMLPSSRFFPTDAIVGRWLNSSPLMVGGEPSPPPLATGDPGEWRSYVGDTNRFGKRDAQQWLSYTKYAGYFTLTLECDDEGRRDIELRSTAHSVSLRADGSARHSVGYRFDGAQRWIEATWYAYSSYAYDRRVFYPDGVVTAANRDFSFFRSLIGKQRLEVEFEDGERHERADFDLRGMTNTEAWPYIRDCGG